MTQEQANIIEQERNIIIDAESEMCTTGEREDDYGWQPVPNEWIAE